MFKKALLYGNLTIDHNVTESGKYVGPGGSVYFMTRTFTNLGIASTVVSPYGKDFPKEFLSKTSIFPEDPPCEKTLIFKNILKKDGRRTQYTERFGKAEIIKVENIAKKALKKTDILAVAPILDNISYQDVLKLLRVSKPKFKLLLPQGFFRSIDDEGQVFQKDWQEAKKVVKHFNLVVVSEEDYPQIETQAEEWSFLGPITVVTKKDTGCIVFYQDKRYSFPAFSVPKIIDSTGAGDVFAAAFAFMYIKNRDIAMASDFANAASALSLKFTSNKLEYGKEDVEKLIKND